VLLQVHCTLTIPKIDCGSFVYSPASKSILSSLDPTHSAEIWLTLAPSTQAFMRKQVNWHYAFRETCLSLVIQPGSQHILTTHLTVQHFAAAYGICMRQILGHLNLWAYISSNF